MYNSINFSSCCSVYNNQQIPIISKKTPSNKMQINSMTMFVDIFVSPLCFSLHENICAKLIVINSVDSKLDDLKCKYVKRFQFLPFIRYKSFMLKLKLRSRCAWCAFQFLSSIKKKKENMSRETKRNEKNKISLFWMANRLDRCRQTHTFFLSFHLSVA